MSYRLGTYVYIEPLKSVPPNFGWSINFCAPLITTNNKLISKHSRYCAVQLVQRHFFVAHRR